MKNWLAPVALALSVVAVGAMLVNGRAAVPAEVVLKEKDKEKEKRTISTSGSATIRVKPDAARLFFSVTSEAGTVKEARAQTAAKFNKVNAALVDLKVPDLKMKTSDITLEPVYLPAHEGHPAQLTGYRSTHSFTVLVTDTNVEKLSANAGRVLDSGFENGVNVMQQIVFLKLDEKETRRQAMTKAVEEAMNNARAIGAGAHIELVEPVAISGEPAYRWGGGRSSLQNVQSVGPVGGGGDSTEMVAGDLEVTCSVSVICHY
jgi:uncharacterized protein YggE